MCNSLTHRRELSVWARPAAGGAGRIAQRVCRPCSLRGALRFARQQQQRSLESVLVSASKWKGLSLGQRGREGGESEAGNWATRKAAPRFALCPLLAGWAHSSLACGAAEALRGCVSAWPRSAQDEFAQSNAHRVGVSCWSVCGKSRVGRLTPGADSLTGGGLAGASLKATLVAGSVSELLQLPAPRRPLLCVRCECVAFG